MSMMVGNIVLKAQESHPEIPAHVVASGLSLVVGLIILFIGLIRAGWIVEFVPLVATTAFMTGSAINIIAGQLPFLLGITGFNALDVPYKVIVNTFANLRHAKLDAAVGISALAALYLYRFTCDLLGRRMSKWHRLFFFLSTLRTAFVILLYTITSFLINHNHPSKPFFRLVGHVPSGFQNAGVPVMNQQVISTFASELPAGVLVLLIEHIAIAKSFGRINGYTIDSSQELIAIGISNILGPFLGAFPVTGSFSRTAIKSKAGVRTPLASVITARRHLCPGGHLHFDQYLITFASGVMVTIFMGVENGIYTTIGMSASILLFRVLKSKGTFLSPVENDKAMDTSSKGYGRTVFLPIQYRPNSGPSATFHTPLPSIFIYRFSEGFNYLNASRHLDELVTTILANTRQTVPKAYDEPGERPWNDPGPGASRKPDNRGSLPTLKAIILDFSSVASVDITAVQNLVDVRSQLDRWAAPNAVQWHFVSVSNAWIKRALESAGFGGQTLFRDTDADALFSNHCHKGSFYHLDICCALEAVAMILEHEEAVEKLGGTDIGSCP
ncbi:hypothetical protein HIM_12223 [Hirsutella minnesotensis 3608]|uniref:STAS domain-containing protein n=1 Tax=Hirsutella minnesotensis 3608 TaxID=1043627 RepID=A0A0F7ZI99_9HYPO|nr:hypothetical protein HIM_12223 [Hirsutella minnesotensis 3608]